MIRYKKYKVVDKDNGFKKLSGLFNSKEVSIDIGIIGKDATAKHPNSNATIAEIGAVHEYGIPSRNIPRRSFLRDTLEMNSVKIGKTLQNAAYEAIKTGDPEKALSKVGAWFVGVVQKRIDDGIMPPLTLDTIKRKGSSKILIDTGTLRQSISFRIVKSLFSRF